ncbi:unnamed protein product, partial [marine sediment metagenome]
ISKIDLEVINNAYLEVFTSPLKNDVQRELRLISQIYQQV